MVLSCYKDRVNLLKTLNSGSHSTQEATYCEVLAVITEQDPAKHARNLQKLTKIQALLQVETEQALSRKARRQAPNRR